MRSMDEVVAIDLGRKATKAVHLRRKGSEIFLVRTVLLSAPSALTGLAGEPLVDHLKAVQRALKVHGRPTFLALSPELVLVTSAELPPVPVSDLRKMIRLNPKGYLQQDLKEHWFDCHVGETISETDGVAGGRPRRRAQVWVAAAPARLVTDVETACRAAGVRPAGITVQSLGLAPASQLQAPDLARETTVMLDIGLRSTTICVVRLGEPLLIRVVNQGAERIQEILEQASKGQSREASGEGDALHETLQRTVQGIAREVDVSIRFIASKHETAVSQVIVCGGSARSQFVIQALEAELNLPCQSWKPGPDQIRCRDSAQREELDFEAPQMAVCLGVGCAALTPAAVRINLLAERHETEWRRRRDPFRRAAVVAAILLLGMLGWIALLDSNLRQMEREVENGQERLDQFRKTTAQSLAGARRTGDLDQLLHALQFQATHREAWASILNTLQFATVPQIQFHSLRIEQVLTREKRPPLKPKDPKTPTIELPPNVRERLVLTITGKNYGPDARVDELILMLENDAFLKPRLVGSPPILLRDLQPRQVDPLDARQAFRLFRIECILSEHLYTHD